MTMQTFSGREYLKIDIASKFGHDKLDWDDRIQWFNDNEGKLHSLVQHAEEPALFYAGIVAWEKALDHKPCGYPISLDATCSGIQILAALACDRKAAEICNVVDTGHREDAYVSIYQKMVTKLGTSARIDRKATKQAIMTAFYGSTATPKSIFGEGKLLETFYETMMENAPGAWEINETMLAIWDDTALVNEWVLPDNFHVKVKVMGQQTQNVSFLGENYSIPYSVNMPIFGGRSLGANMVHSIDGMIVREMNRRCNYEPMKIDKLRRIAEAGGGGARTRMDGDILVQKLWDHYQKTGFLSARILEYLNIDNMGLVDPKAIAELTRQLPSAPFQVISIHDCFRCLPNHANDLRRQYNLLLSMVARSSLLGSIISQISRRSIFAGKLDMTLPADIEATNYSLS
jgi:DNA-dependent RNA polymerase